MAAEEEVGEAHAYQLLPERYRRLRVHVPTGTGENMYALRNQTREKCVALALAQGRPPRAASTDVAQEGHHARRRDTYLCRAPRTVHETHAAG